MVRIELHAPTILVISATLGLMLAGGCLTFRKSGRLGAAAIRLGIGNFFLAMACLVRIFSIEFEHPILLGGGFALMSAGLLIHLSALRQMVAIESIDRWLFALFIAHILAMVAASSDGMTTFYYALGINAITFVTSFISIMSTAQLKGDIFKHVRYSLLMAFFGMGAIAMMQATMRILAPDATGGSNSVSTSLLGLTVFLVGVNLTYLALYMTLQRHVITRLANQDHLTELLNRRGLEVFLNHRLQQSGQRLTGSVLLVDIDRFKSINDNLGHTAGDHVLTSIGKVLKSKLRSDDAAGRVGGEEFALVLPNLSAAQAEGIAERLRQELSDLKISTEDFDNISITVSIGVAEFDIDKPALDQLLQRSDEALNTAKANGRNRTEVWSPKLEMLMHALRFQKPDAKSFATEPKLA